MNSMTKSPTTKGPPDLAQLRPLDALKSAVRQAVGQYDLTTDHTSHGPDADCVRCQLLAVLTDGLVEAWNRPPRQRQS